MAKGKASQKEKHPQATPRVPDAKMLELLVCPLTHGPLVYDRKADELISKKARLAFPVREGVPIMLIEEARKLVD